MPAINRRIETMTGVVLAEIHDDGSVLLVTASAGASTRVALNAEQWAELTAPGDSVKVATTDDRGLMTVIEIPRTEWAAMESVLV